MAGSPSKRANMQSFIHIAITFGSLRTLDFQPREPPLLKPLDWLEARLDTAPQKLSRNQELPLRTRLISLPVVVRYMKWLSDRNCSIQTLHSSNTFTREGTQRIRSCWIHHMIASGCALCLTILWRSFHSYDPRLKACVRHATAYSDGILRLAPWKTR